MVRKTQRKLCETDLYPPIRDFLTRNGYTVHGEVQDCDVTAVKGEELIVIELKLRLNIELLAQAVERQRITESVYVAVPRTEMTRWQNRWSRIKHLLRRLEIGLILVSPGPRSPSIEILFHLLPSQRRKTKRLGRAVLQEIQSRSVDVNLGGSSRKPIMTAYKENALQIALYLDAFGPLSPKRLRELGTGPKTTSILYNNFLNWFERVDHGIYGLKQEGREALDVYPEIAEWHRKRLKGEPGNE